MITEDQIELLTKAVASFDTREPTDDVRHIRAVTVRMGEDFLRTKRGRPTSTINAIRTNLANIRKAQADILPTVKLQDWAKLEWGLDGAYLIAYHRQSEKMLVDRVFVPECLRRTGRFTQLLNCAEKEAERLGKIIEIWPSVEYPWLIPWLEKRGYIHTAEGFWDKHPPVRE